MAANGPENTLPGPLAGLRVLELTNEHAQFCGKLMADMGADVIKIEPPGGQETRNIGPFLDDEAHPERSLYFWHYNTSKRGITLDITKPEGQEVFRKLAATAGLVLESFPPGYMKGTGVGLRNPVGKQSRPHHVLRHALWAGRPLA